MSIEETLYVCQPLTLTDQEIVSKRELSNGEQERGQFNTTVNNKNYKERKMEKVWVGL
jgi:hypothetical protein